jgi:sulfur carrier protein
VLPDTLILVGLSLIINGQQREFEQLAGPVPLARVIELMELKADRVAVEHNGEIAPRATWQGVEVVAGDKLEVVHFVGGGSRQDRLQGTHRLHREVGRGEKRP